MSDLYRQNLVKAIELYGVNSQLEMMQEECGELITVINQYKRGRKSELSIFSEIADIRIMLDQFDLIFASFEKEMEEALKYKRTRFNNMVMVDLLKSQKS